MGCEEFRKRVFEVIGPDGWFQPLSPYGDGETLFALEDVNHKLIDDQSGKVNKSHLECCIAGLSVQKGMCFSTFNERGETVIRKVSGHGLGDLRRTYEIDGIISKLPQLQVPQYSQVALSSTHLFDLYPNLPERRGFQFFVSFPAPRGPLHSKEVPFDEHKALRETTLYASVPKGGVDAALLEEWKATGTGLYRKDNNEFPHGLFDPKWKLRLQTVADRFQGYFDHPEPKSNGRVGELKCTNSKRM
jgi:hypothetical protein